MVRRSASLFFLLALLVLGTFCQAVSRAEIKRVRSKSVLDADDLRQIDLFVQESVQELVNAEDFSDISRKRDALLTSQTGTNSASAEQYEQAYMEACEEHVSEALKTVGQMNPVLDRFRIAAPVPDDHHPVDPQ